MQETWVWSWIRKIIWRRTWQSTPVFLSGKSQGQRSLVGNTSQGRKRAGYDWATKQQQSWFRALSHVIDESFILSSFGGLSHYVPWSERFLQCKTPKPIWEGNKMLFVWMAHLNLHILKFYSSVNCLLISLTDIYWEVITCLLCLALEIKHELDSFTIRC